MKKLADTTSRWSPAPRPRAVAGGGAPASPRSAMRLAYLTTIYPAVSHTFIRHEVLELDRRGHDVSRFSIRRPQGDLVDQADVAEAANTRYVLGQSAVTLLASTLYMFLAHPARWFNALRKTLAMSRASSRGLFAHMAYLVEACWLTRQLKRERIQHLHVHFGTNAAAVALLSRLLGGPTFSMTVHGPDEFDAPVGLSLAEKGAAASAVMAITHYCAAQLRRWIAPEHWSRIHVVRCTPGHWQDEDPPAVDPASRILVCVGRLTAQKGQLLLVEAMRQIIDDGVAGQLILAGDGEMRQAVERRIAELDLADHVRITGWVTGQQVRDLLRESRAMVLPSFAEGLPVVIMEAFAAARPVVSTFVAGIPELVEPGVSGWLTPAGDVDALAGAMRDALTMSVDELNVMGRAGHARVTRQHDVNTELTRLEAIFGLSVGDKA